MDEPGKNANSAVTFTYWRLGKVSTTNALFYAIAQFAGGVSGVLFTLVLLGDLFRLPPVRFVVTKPGAKGVWWALAAEFVMSFLMMFGKERGWSLTTRAHFDATRGPKGALLIGDAETVAEKLLYVNEALGGLSRVTCQMGISTLPHQKMRRAIEILGSRVAPWCAEH